MNSVDEADYPEFEPMICAECGLEVEDYYMVYDSLWNAVGAGDGFLHIRCLEDRLGRPLTVEDFTLCNCNEWQGHIPKRLT